MDQFIEGNGAIGLDRLLKHLGNRLVHGVQGDRFLPVQQDNLFQHPPVHQAHGL